MKGTILPLSSLPVKKNISVIKVEKWKCRMKGKGTGKTSGNLVASPSQIRKGEINVCINSLEQMLFSVGTRDSQICKHILKQLTKTTVN